MYLTNVIPTSDFLLFSVCSVFFSDAVNNYYSDCMYGTNGKWINMVVEQKLNDADGGKIIILLDSPLLEIFGKGKPVNLWCLHIVIPLRSCFWLIPTFSYCFFLRKGFNQNVFLEEDILFSACSVLCPVCMFIVILNQIRGLKWITLRHIAMTNRL